MQGPNVCDTTAGADVWFIGFRNWGVIVGGCSVGVGAEGNCVERTRLGGKCGFLLLLAAGPGRTSPEV